MPDAAPGGPTPSEDFLAVNAIRDAIPTRAHAEMLFSQVLDLLGDAAWVETANGEQSRTLFRREAAGSPWIVPWPLISVSRGGREGPSPILTAVPGVYQEVPRRPGAAPKIRGLGPGQLTIHDGAHSLTLCYGADGRWFECSVTHWRIRGAFFAVGPKSDAPPVEPTVANSPVAVIPVAELPDTTPAFGGWVRTVDRWGGLRLALLRRERRGCTLVGDIVMGQDLASLDARLDAADRAWDAEHAAHPRPTVELPPGFPEPPPTDTSVRTYRVVDAKTWAPIQATCVSAGRVTGYDARGLDAEQVRSQVVRMRRDRG